MGKIINYERAKEKLSKYYNDDTEILRFNAHIKAILDWVEANRAELGMETNKKGRGKTWQYTKQKK